MKSPLSFLFALAAFSTAGVHGSVFEMRRVEARGTPQATAFKLDRAGRTDTVFLSNEVLLDRSGLAGARVVQERVNVTSGRNPEQKTVPAIQLSFTGKGQKQFAALTKSMLGKQVGIVIDGRLIAAPVLREGIAGGSVTLSGIFTKEDAAALVAKVKSGK